MKFIAFFAIAAAFMTLTPTQSFAEDAKVKTHWILKDRNGKRTLTVFLKNEGAKELKKGQFNIIVNGANAGERQIEPLAIDLPLNRELTVDIRIKETNGGVSGGSGGFTGLKGGATDANGKPLDAVVGTVTSVVVSPIETSAL